MYVYFRGENFGIGTIQDILFVQIMKIYIIHVVGIEFAKPQLRNIYRILNDIAMSFSQEHMHMHTDIRVIQYTSPSCRASRMFVTKELAAAKILRVMNDTMILQCNNHSIDNPTNDSMNHRNSTIVSILNYWLLLLIITLPAVTFVTNTFLSEMILESLLPAISSAFLLYNQLLYSINPIIIIIIYILIIIMCLLYYYKFIFINNNSNNKRINDLNNSFRKNQNWNYIINLQTNRQTNTDGTNTQTNSQTIIERIYIQLIILKLYFIEIINNIFNIIILLYNLIININNKTLNYNNIQLKNKQKYELNWNNLNKPLQFHAKTLQIVIEVTDFNDLLEEINENQAINEINDYLIHLNDTNNIENLNLNDKLNEKYSNKQLTDNNVNNNNSKQMIIEIDEMIDMLHGTTNSLSPTNSINRMSVSPMNLLQTNSVSNRNNDNNIPLKSLSSPWTEIETTTHKQMDTNTHQQTHTKPIIIIEDLMSSIPNEIKQLFHSKILLNHSINNNLNTNTNTHTNTNVINQINTQTDVNYEIGFESYLTRKYFQPLDFTQTDKQTDESEYYKLFDNNYSQFINKNKIKSKYSYFYRKLQLNNLTTNNLTDGQPQTNEQTLTNNEIFNFSYKLFIIKCLENTNNYNNLHNDATTSDTYYSYETLMQLIETYDEYIWMEDLNDYLCNFLSIFIFQLNNKQKLFIINSFKMNQTIETNELNASNENNDIEVEVEVKFSNEIIINELIKQFNIIILNNLQNINNNENIIGFQLKQLKVWLQNICLTIMQAID